MKYLSNGFGEMWRRLGRAGMPALILAGSALSPARADVVTNTSVSSATWNVSTPSSLTLQLQQIDTNLSYFGSVLSIQFRMYATNMADISVENWDPSTDNEVVITLTSTTRGTNAIGQGVTVSTLYDAENPLATVTLGPNTGTNQSGADYIFFDNLMAAGAASNLITSGFSSLYFGNGSFNFFVRASAGFAASGSAAWGSSFADLRSLGRVEVAYTYTLIPEPASWVPCAVAGVVALALLRLRRAGRAKRGLHTAGCARGNRNLEVK
jgi:hypothetical protein